MSQFFGLFLNLFKSKPALDPEETLPQICPMNEGDRLCIHRSHDMQSIIQNAYRLGYGLADEAMETCPYMHDHDHYPVTKLI